MTIKIAFQATITGVGAPPVQQGPHWGNSLSTSATGAADLSGGESSSHYVSQTPVHSWYSEVVTAALNSSTLTDSFDGGRESELSEQRTPNTLPLSNFFLLLN